MFGSLVGGRLIPLSLVPLGGLVVSLGCGSPSVESESTGIAQVALTQTPSDVNCLEILAKGSRQVVKRFAVTPGTSPVFEMSGLPVGQVEFSANAFSEMCSGATMRALPTWRSDPRFEMVVAGALARVMLVMRRSGHASVSVDFRDCAAERMELGVDFVPNDMNNRRQVVGVDVGAVSGQAVIWDAGTVRALTPELDSAAFAINDRGQIAGRIGTRAVLWDDGVTYDIGVLASPVALNENGQVVVWTNQIAFATRGHVWERHTGLVDIGTLGGSETLAMAINANGEVAGGSRVADGRMHAFIWQAGTMRDIGPEGAEFSQAVDINASGQVVGQSLNQDGAWHAFVWDAGTIVDLGTLGAPYVQPMAINATGVVLGAYSSDSWEPSAHVFVWRDGVVSELIGFGSHVTTVAGRKSINALGDVVGYDETASGELHGILWRNNIRYDLGTVGVPQTMPYAINDAGQIMGITATSTGRQKGFFLDVSTCPADEIPPPGQP